MKNKYFFEEDAVYASYVVDHLPFYLLINGTYISNNKDYNI